MFVASSEKFKLLFDFRFRFHAARRFPMDWIVVSFFLYNPNQKQFALIISGATLLFSSSEPSRGNIALNLARVAAKNITFGQFVSKKLDPRPHVVWETNNPCVLLVTTETFSMLTDAIS
mmetsp:Transcript_27531/g.64557  ORF Transcript_27531/g.64557 Transcript_27531/m.64557 type:complete len:119 (-) Transcript_27531:363-719(-)